MKTIFKSMLLFAATATLLASCSDNDEPTPTPNAPTITWENGDIDAVHEITKDIAVKINLDVPGGIEKLLIKIESPALTDAILSELGLATEMDLTKPTTPKMEATLKSLGFPAGAAIKGTTKQSFDISTLIPLITQIYTKTSNHNFKLTLTDAAAQSVTKTLKFHQTDALVFNEDIDLWKNTASFTATITKAGTAVVEYKKSTSTTWQKSVIAKNADGTFTATITPTWVEAGTHATGVAQYTLNNETGVFAGHTYNVRLMVDNVELAKVDFDTAAGQTFDNGNMETWSKYIGYNDEWADDPNFAEYKVDYPNAEAKAAFWSNGNNAFTKGLCTPFEISKTNKCAYLKGNNFGGIFAAGNLFSGRFEMAGMSGSARFGQIYPFTARPTAVKVRYKAKVLTITLINGNEEFAALIPAKMQVGKTDPCSIMVCITDWSDRHSVNSGIGVTFDKVNAFDPAADKAEPAEGKILAYASKLITESTPDWVELTIPIVYKDKEAKPAAEKYALVFSAASSAYGDYLSGNPDNEMLLDDIEWIY